ncbi:hypothetical protein YC2023_105808 [Brassica napus]
MVSYSAFAVTMLVAMLTVQWLGCNFAGGYPEEDLVVRLPGQPKVLFRQYAGYVDVDSETCRSLFYYFVEADTQPETKPLTLWLNRGPGCSSVGGGAFTELGPFYPTGDDRGLRINSMSWNKASNLLFVDSPAGVGWSYSNTSSDYNTGDETTASDMLVFLLRWFNKFPELKARHLFLTGESYAGHYIPQLADAIHSYNRQSSGFKINVKGIAIGNPLLKLDTDTGDQDSVVPLLGSRTLVRELAHDLNFSTTLPYGPWFHKNQVGGWVTEYGKILTFATVRGAAHMVPYAQPSRALHIFSSFVRGRRLPNSTHYSPDE